jgi:hypothetical protein
MRDRRRTRLAAAGIVCALLAAAGIPRSAAQSDAEATVLELLREDRPYTVVPPDVVDRLGWDIPDGGKQVHALAEQAPGSAFDPRALEALKGLGYRASWHVVRYKYYGLDWDITGLHLMPDRPLTGLPTVAYINGGSANWYEFFVDPLNNPAIGQYLAQRVPVLLVTIPGNYKPGGWTETDNAARKPAYLLDREIGGNELRARNAVYTFTLISEGVRLLAERATKGPLLISGHSTGGEIQFLLRDVLGDRLNGRSLGWGTGGPASLRRVWEQSSRVTETYPPVTDVRGRSAQQYSNSYVGPLNPVPGKTKLEVAEAWFAREGRRRPHFKQVIQDLEHLGLTEHRAAAERQIREAIAAAKLPIDAEAVIRDLLSTVRAPVDGYRRMIWTTALADNGHWDEDPEKALELVVANEFRKANRQAEIRVLVFGVPMSHYGHIERPRQLAGGTLAAVKWLYE